MEDGAAPGGDRRKEAQKRYSNEGQEGELKKDPALRFVRRYETHGI